MTEHSVLSEAARFGLGTEDGRHDRRAPGLVHGEIEHPAWDAIAEERCSDRVTHELAFAVLRGNAGPGPVAQRDERAHLLRRRDQTRRRDGEAQRGPGVGAAEKGPR